MTALPRKIVDAIDALEQAFGSDDRLVKRAALEVEIRRALSDRDRKLRDITAAIHSFVRSLPAPDALPDPENPPQNLGSEARK